MNYNLIVAMYKNSRGIGYNGKIPWHSKADMLHFYKLTKGNSNNAVIMGSTTWKSLPKKMLPLRDNLILSSTTNLHTIMGDGHIIKTFPHIEDVIKFCELMEYDQVWIIGGESIYKQFLDKKQIDKCYITLVDDNENNNEKYECDTFFPELDENEWKVDNKYMLPPTSTDTDTCKSEVHEFIKYHNKDYLK